MRKQFPMWIFRVDSCMDCPFYSEDKVVHRKLFTCHHPDVEVRPKSKRITSEVFDQLCKCRDKNCPLNDGPITIDKGEK